jgi:hypothetical protein
MATRIIVVVWTTLCLMAGVLGGARWEAEHQRAIYAKQPSVSLIQPVVRCDYWVCR